MTDKQINTCEFLNICQTDCNGTLEDTEMCHCYELYKQLKRKEQECERLKQEQIEIKKYLGISSKTIMERLEELQEFRDRDRNKLYKAEQALADIKKIAEEQQSWNEINSRHAETESEDDIFAYNWSALKQILQLISEVDDDRQD